MYVFLGKIASPLVKSVRDSFSDGELSIAQRQAVIVLIEKKGRNKRLAKN